MNTPLNGFAALLHAALGTQWQQLHPHIRARFALAPGTARQRFTGSMSEINRSPIGWLIAKLIAFVRILPAKRARDVPFEFNLSPASTSAPTPASGWIKERLYHFHDGRFEFRIFGVDMRQRVMPVIKQVETNDDPVKHRDDRHDQAPFPPGFKTSSAHPANCAARRRYWSAAAA